MQSQMHQYLHLRRPLDLPNHWACLEKSGIPNFIFILFFPCPLLHSTESKKLIILPRPLLHYTIEVLYYFATHCCIRSLENIYYFLIRCQFNRWQDYFISCCPLMEFFYFFIVKVFMQSSLSKFVYFCLSIEFLSLCTNVVFHVDCCFSVMLLKCMSAKFGTLQQPSKRSRTPSADNRPQMPGETIIRYNKRPFKLSDAHQAKVYAGVNEVIKILKLQASHNNIGPLTGGIPLACNTMQSYGKHYESIQYFFSQI